MLWRCPNTGTGNKGPGLCHSPVLFGRVVWDSRWQGPGGERDRLARHPSPQMGPGDSGDEAGSQRARTEVEPRWFPVNTAIDPNPLHISCRGRLVEGSALLSEEIGHIHGGLIAKRQNLLQSASTE